jgi:hypothetical protein
MLSLCRSHLRKTSTPLPHTDAPNNGGLGSHPFVWTKTADQILTRVGRPTTLLGGSRHLARSRIRSGRRQCPNRKQGNGNQESESRADRIITIVHEGTKSRDGTGSQRTDQTTPPQRDIHRFMEK